MTTPRKEKKKEARREEKFEKRRFWIRVLKKNCLNDLREEFMVASEDEDEEEPEIEYVEGYEELEEEDDMEDFGGLAIDKSDTDVDNDAVGIDDADEETIAIDRKRLRRDSQRKLEKDEPRAKPKRVRVLVEISHCIMISLVVESGKADCRRLKV
ncbi:hypothetical protein LOK49_LG06G02556 [Camellia lanceoleosa]|uniref:Uncharacterized protein n=1 Tax=Camellia lanceoleosa TaxID=1840588 RepID=A0ACC0HHB2_9ERIC|nr:hypothetical protein LOK49_LG06G02556 [Camellia lanceoleosa]